MQHRRPGAVGGADAPPAAAAWAVGLSRLESVLTGTAFLTSDRDGGALGLRLGRPRPRVRVTRLDSAVAVAPLVRPCRGGSRE